jgi:NAD(P)-dependent dehydrogenase (short-subunit alcohol dehydrogenase family)
MKTWMITGASRGFGAKIALQALQAGDRVVATARRAQAVVEALGNHPNLLAVELDVTSQEQAERAVEQAVDRFGSIDVLVNNAGFGLLGAVEEASPAEVESLYRTNVFGLLAVTRAVLPQMRRQRSGHILNFSSIGGYRAAAGFGVYSSTKFAVEGLSEALAAELQPLGVQVTIVEPGYFRTDFLDERSLTVSPSRIDDYTTTAGAVREKARVISHNQPGDPDKLAAAILQVANHPKAPMRLALGSDTVAAIEEKNRSVQAELDAWRELSLSTDYQESRV